MGRHGRQPTTAAQLWAAVVLAAAVVAVALGAVVLMKAKSGGSERPAERRSHPSPTSDTRSTLPGAPEPTHDGEDAPLVPGSRCGERQEGWVGMHRSQMYRCTRPGPHWREVI